MKISSDEVRRIAALAHLHLEADELARMGDELSKILDYIDQLAEVDLSAISGESASAEPTPLREDHVRPSLDINEIARNAPEFREGHFVVPKIIG